MDVCCHRTAGRWGRWWTGWLAAVVGSFIVAETAAIVTDGTPATLSAYLRRAAGLDPPCRHSRAGRALILVATGWCGLHLSWDVLGVKFDGRND